MLPLEFLSLGFVTVACPYDVLACLQVFPALAVDAFLGEELPPEFSCVRVRVRCDIGSGGRIPLAGFGVP